MEEGEGVPSDSSIFLSGLGMVVGGVVLDMISDIVMAKLEEWQNGMLRGSILLLPGSLLSMIIFYFAMPIQGIHMMIVGSGILDVVSLRVVDACLIVLGGLMMLIVHFSADRRGPGGGPLTTVPFQLGLDAVLTAIVHFLGWLN